MNRNWNRRATGGLPILSAALLSAVALIWDGASSTAAAQSNSGASNQVIVNYDALNALPGPPAPNGWQGAPAGAPPAFQHMPRYAPVPGPYGMAAPVSPYPPYGAMQAGVPYAAPLAPAMVPGLAAPPPGMPTSVLTAVGPDGRPIAPIRLRKPGSEAPGEQAESARSQMAAVSPPTEPADVPENVPMPEPTPPAPPPAVEAEPEQPAVEAPDPVAAPPPPEEPQPAEQSAEEQSAEDPPADGQAVQEQPAETPVEETPADSEAADGEAAEEPTEQAAAEPAPEPDNSRPAAPIPQGGIRIVFPVDLNDVPVEANAALDDLAAQMLADENMRIQIMCYASGTEETESKARRKSLARCINIRQYLFKKDVRTTRMDVRALGLKSEGQPSDRVDIVPANS